MLGQLLALIKTNQGIISRDELCETLDITPETLEILLSSLTRMGRLVEVIEEKPTSCATCEDCILKQQCDLVSLFQEKRYQVADRFHQAKSINPIET
jgi:hypothetical protein